MRRTCAWCIWHKIIVLGCVVLGCVGLGWSGLAGHHFDIAWLFYWKDSTKKIPEAQKLPNSLKFWTWACVAAQDQDKSPRGRQGTGTALFEATVWLVSPAGQAQWVGAMLETHWEPGAAEELGGHIAMGSLTWDHAERGHAPRVAWQLSCHPGGPSVFIHLLLNYALGKKHSESALLILQHLQEASSRRHSAFHRLLCWL